VQDDREAGDAALHLFENVEAEGRNLFARFYLELVGAVGGADRDRQAVDAGLGDKLLNVVGIGVMAGFVADLVLDAGQNAKLAFD